MIDQALTPTLNFLCCDLEHTDILFCDNVATSFKNNLLHSGLIVETCENSMNFGVFGKVHKKILIIFII